MKHYFPELEISFTSWNIIFPYYLTIEEIEKGVNYSLAASHEWGD